MLEGHDTLVDDERKCDVVQQSLEGLGKRQFMHYLSATENDYEESQVFHNGGKSIHYGHVATNILSLITTETKCSGRSIFLKRFSQIQIAVD